MRLLMAEDDQPLARFLCTGLEAENYTVDLAADGQQASILAETTNYDLLILDLTLPQMDGLEVLKSIRANDSAMPVLVLTGRNHVQDRVECLDLGADDCLIKPFSYLELSARVRALLRRGGQAFEPVLRYGDMEMVRSQRRVSRAGRLINLTIKEFSLLELLMLHAGTPVSRALIIEHIWNLTPGTVTNVVDVYINYLRKKIDYGVEDKLIYSVRGVGYQLGKSHGLSS